MGLDMYLSKKNYVKNWSHMTEERKHKITVKLGGKTRKDIKPKRIAYITEEVMYWRKANHIHDWFVQNCYDGKDECQEVYVGKEKLEELAALCEEVTQTCDAGILPTTSGFFFGSTSYDDYYFDECQRTAKELRKLLAEEGNGEYYYQSSW